MVAAAAGGSAGRGVRAASCEVHDPPDERTPDDGHARLRGCAVDQDPPDERAPLPTVGVLLRACDVPRLFADMGYTVLIGSPESAVS